VGVRTVPAPAQRPYLVVASRRRPQSGCRTSTTTRRERTRTRRSSYPHAPYSGALPPLLLLLTWVRFPLTRVRFPFAPPLLGRDGRCRRPLLLHPTYSSRSRSPRWRLTGRRLGRRRWRHSRRCPRSRVGRSRLRRRCVLPWRHPSRVLLKVARRRPRPVKRRRRWSLSRGDRRTSTGGSLPPTQPLWERGVTSSRSTAPSPTRSR